MAADPITRFRIQVPDEVLSDLRERVVRTRWPEALPDPDWEYGIEQGVLRELAGYWADGYDWRAYEAELNAFDQFRAEIDGQQIHFLHARSQRADAIPLIMSHGWPGSVAEFLKIIRPLTDPAAHGAAAEDAFHLVCPSLPGYGFSTPTNTKGWNTRRTGKAFAALMARLGYSRYGAQGGDWGSFVSQYIARHDPAHCFAIHLNFLFTPPTGPEMVEALSGSERERYERFQRYAEEGSGYAQIQATKPETLGYALVDSPVGLLAWIAEKYQAWTDCGGKIENAVSRDELLTTVTLYWVTGTAASSARFYRETRRGGAYGFESDLETPVGFACFPKEVVAAPRAWIEKRYNVVQWTDMPRGGHFPALEQPELLVEDIRRFFRRFR